MSDPDGTPSQAEVYRLAIIRQLISHPDFGLKQVIPSQHEFDRITSVDQVKTCRDLLKRGKAHLPLVVFSQVMAESPKPPFDGHSPTTFQSTATFPYPPCKTQRINFAISDPPYDIENFAKYGVSLCRTYLLEESARERFSRGLKCDIHPGGIAVLEPNIFGSGIHIYPFKPGKMRQDAIMSALQTEMYQYPRNRKISFGNLQL